MVYNQYDPFPESSPLHAPAEEFEQGANQVIEETAGALNVPVLDAYSAFNGNQMTLVRVAENDVHPTPLGQQALAALLENEIKQLTLPTGAKAGASNAIVTSLASQPLSPTGNTWTAPLGKGDVTVTTPAGAVSSADNVAVTSVDPAAAAGQASKGSHVVAEFGINFQAGNTPTQAITLAYTNSAIPKDAAVYEIGANGKLVKIPDATVGKGKVTMSVLGDGDFVVVAPTPAAPKQPAPVPGATSPDTGFPWLTDAIAGALLVAFGAFVMSKSKSRK